LETLKPLINPVPEKRSRLQASPGTDKPKLSRMKKAPASYSGVQSGSLGLFVSFPGASGFIRPLNS
jgi:hypothetical protein